MTNAFSPEELETLLEDALLVGDQSAVANLLTEGALLGEGSGDLRGASRIADHLLRSESETARYLAGTGRVLLARDVALVLNPNWLNVASRSSQGSWRFVILHHAGRKE